LVSSGRPRLAELLVACVAARELHEPAHLTNGVGPGEAFAKFRPCCLAMPPRMRTLFLSLFFIVAVLAFLHQANHAHAGEPTRCGFWGSMEAGMSCR
jgi:hypothetical protein